MSSRAKRFLNGHYEEFLPEYLIVAIWLVAGIIYLGRQLWRF